MAFYSLVACTEKNGSRVENYGMPLSGSSSVTLYCAWANAINLVSDILDNRRTDPLHPGLFASKASVKAAGGETSGYTVDEVSSPQLIIPDVAEVTVTYGTLDAEEREANPAGDPNAEWYTENIEPTLEFMTLNHNDFQWGSAIPGIPLKPEEAPGRLIPGLKLIRHFRNVATLPTGIASLMGKVNNTLYTSMYLDGITFGVETLLYQPPVISRVVKRNGSGAWDYKTEFLYKEHGWNKYWHAIGQAYLSLYTRENPPVEYKNYEPENLSTLLNV